jgi:hypothetical protein
MVKDAIDGVKRKKNGKDAEPMFVRPTQMLAKSNSFRPDLAVSHVTSPVQATRIMPLSASLLKGAVRSSNNWRQSSHECDDQGET